MWWCGIFFNNRDIKSNSVLNHVTVIWEVMFFCTFHMYMNIWLYMIYMNIFNIWYIIIYSIRLPMCTCVCMYVSMCSCSVNVSLCRHIFAHTCRNPWVLLSIIFNCPPPDIRKDPLMKPRSVLYWYVSQLALEICFHFPGWNYEWIAFFI